jgi:tetratricopeptide (TPR) repeat protein
MRVLVRMRKVAAHLAVLLLCAGAALAHGPLAARIEELDRRLRGAPTNAGLYVERAEAHRVAGHFVAAAQDLERAAALAPELAEVLLYRALLARDLQRPADALHELGAYLERAETSGAATVVYALTVRAEISLDLGRSADALADLRQAIERQPSASPELYQRCAELILAVHGAAGRLDALALLDLGIERLGPVVSLEQAAIDIELALGRRERAAERAAAMQNPSPAPRPIPPQRGPLVSVGAGSVATLVRGPYLQQGTATSGILRWRTSAATASRLEYGPAADQLINVVDDAALVVDHVVKVDNLAPGTRTYYAIGSPEGRLAGGDSAHFFATAPTPGAAHPVRIWVIGDSGTASAAAANVRDSFLAYAGAARPDLWLMLGDNAYVSGTDSEYQQAVFDFYPSVLRSTWLWPTIGNHDALSADSPTQSGPYFDIFTLPTLGEAGGLLSGTEAYYAFDWADVHFVVLDSSDSDLAPGSAQMQWLAADLALRDRQWLICTFHHPPYTKGSHDSDNVDDSGGRMQAMRQTALPLLEAAGVDLVLTGHSHSYERSYLLAGHYGPSDTLTTAMILDGGDGDPLGNGAYQTPGTVYAVAGSSGQVVSGNLNHPAMVVSMATLGSMVLDVAGGRLDAVFLDDAGSIEDAFTLINHELFRDGFERGSPGAWSATSP